MEEKSKHIDGQPRTIPIWTLERYRERIAPLPVPSDAQIDDFVSYVCRAHSWYKHLPLVPPGDDFYFYLNPFAGYDRLLHEDGSVRHEKRTEHTPRFHHSWMTTQEYIRRFGHLAFACRSGTVVQLRPQQGQPRDYGTWYPLVYTAQGSPGYIPEEVAQAGSVKLTAIIWPSPTNLMEYLFVLKEYETKETVQVMLGPGSGLEATGGEVTLQALVAGILRRYAHDDPATRDSLHAFLARLESGDMNYMSEMDAFLTLERERQQGMMRNAIERMLDAAGRR